MKNEKNEGIRGEIISLGRGDGMDKGRVRARPNSNRALERGGWDQLGKERDEPRTLKTRSGG
jgi:hypothetical protein